MDDLVFQIDHTGQMLTTDNELYSLYLTFSRISTCVFTTDENILECGFK